MIKLDTYEKLTRFLTRWYQCEAEDFAWNGELPSGLRLDVEGFYRRFGALTLDESMFSAENLPPPLAAQDLIVPVTELIEREDGGVILIHENQGNWVAGQMRGSDTLWSTIDLELGDTPYPSVDLYDMGITLKSALITHTLHETVMSAVDAGPAFELEEWEAAEDEIIKIGVVERRAYITPDMGALRIGWADRYMATSWGDEAEFTWIVRRGDRAKGRRQAPYTVGKPQRKKDTTKMGFLNRILWRGE